MKNLFKELIADFHNWTIPTPIERDFQLPVLPATVKKVFVFIGMRRI